VTDVPVILRGREKSLGGMPIRRVLPYRSHMMVGPFIYMDHMGPVTLDAGRGVDVPPHPHVGLATVTYLFEGVLTHRDSLGFKQTILPGDVNWMTAGRGIVHSERTPTESRGAGIRMDGIQTWVALPREVEEVEPSFQHHPKTTLPRFELDGAVFHLLAGEAFGRKSPVQGFSDLFYLEVVVSAGTRVRVPDDGRESGAYIAEGAVRFGAEVYGPGTLIVVDNCDERLLVAERDSRYMLLGGTPLDGDRFIWWNFVSTSEHRIEQAKKDWRDNRFPVIPGEGREAPLPDR
jgi:redox-sensitive bicupin YhaK (pirin superfamily)